MLFEMDFVHEEVDSFVVEEETDFERDCDGDSHRRMDFDEVVLLGAGNQSYHFVDPCHDLVGEILNESGNVGMAVNGRGNVGDGYLEVGYMFEAVVVLVVEVEH
jgi:hypothetical protein